MARKASSANRKPTTAKSSRPAVGGRRCSVTFKLHAPHAGSVDVAGSFNNWALRAMKKSKDGHWKTTLRPLAGRYVYKFLVDHQWMADPENTKRARDEHGNENSVLELE